MRLFSPHWRARWNFLRSRLKAPLGNSGRSPRQQFELSIGCVPLRLQISGAQLFGAASARYAAFTDAAVQPITIALNDGAAFERTPAEFSYKFEGAALRAFSSGIRFDGVRNQYALDSLLRVLLSWKLLGRCGFLLHAATIVRNGKAYIFTGRSGAGKSPVASLSPEGTVLPDKISPLPPDTRLFPPYGHPLWATF